MKAIPYLIVGIVVCTVSVNLFLLFDKTYRADYL